MSISYLAALDILRLTAESISSLSKDRNENVALVNATGRVAAQDYCSPETTPPADTSAMDGYAVSSDALQSASLEKPVVFSVKGTIAAGHQPISLSSEPEQEAYPCVEIMTGAQFPTSTSQQPFDACVRIEDTLLISPSKTWECFIQISKPVARNANRRLAGSDFRMGDLILQKGEVIDPGHVMALASVGVMELEVRQKVRVGVMSTGDELNNPNGVRDSNSPFLISSLQELDAEVQFLGVSKDDPVTLHDAIKAALEENDFDILITTGAVSKGRFDHVRATVGGLGGDVEFHGVAIRPGHPVLFATLPGRKGDVAFFGLPGNPIATAGCFRFLVVPFFRCLQSQSQEEPVHAHMAEMTELCSLAHLDYFRHGTLGLSKDGKIMVILSAEQSPAKVKLSQAPIVGYAYRLDMTATRKTREEW